MEPAFMVLGSSVGTWAALAAAANVTTVQDVSEEALHKALVTDGQVLRTPAHVPPVSPHPGPASSGYTCSVGFNRCFASTCSGAGCSNSSMCAGHCPAVGKRQWLALKGSNGGFALQNRGQGASGGGAMAVKALSAKSFLKKSQERSSSLLAGMKRLVAEGTELAIEQMSPVLSGGYWLVTIVSEV